MSELDKHENIHAMFFLNSALLTNSEIAWRSIFQSRTFFKGEQLGFTDRPEKIVKNYSIERL